MNIQESLIADANRLIAILEREENADLREAIMDKVLGAHAFEQSLEGEQQARWGAIFKEINEASGQSGGSWNSAFSGAYHHLMRKYRPRQRMWRRFVVFPLRRARAWLTEREARWVYIAWVAVLFALFLTALGWLSIDYRRVVTEYVTLQSAVEAGEIMGAQSADAGAYPVPEFISNIEGCVDDPPPVQWVIAGLRSEGITRAYVEIFMEYEYMDAVAQLPYVQVVEDYDAVHTDSIMNMGGRVYFDPRYLVTEATARETMARLCADVDAIVERGEAEGR